jgi:tRNA threonylcarbamoyladenosine biosynthesis protein TsaE
VELELVLRSGSPEATEAIGAALGAELAPGAVVALDGELGAGKTCLVRGIARGLGVAEPVSSPSFTLMHEYAGRVAVHHFDAWMTAREAAFLEGGGADALGGEGVALVEWAEHVADYLPAWRLAIRLEHRGPAERRLVLRVLGAPPRADLVAAALAAKDAAEETREAP